MEIIADIINRAIEHVDNDKILSDLKNEVKQLTSGFPLFADMN
jgi:glycine/serine hydroxymethyltransferase